MAHFGDGASYSTSTTNNLAGLARHPDTAGLDISHGNIGSVAVEAMIYGNEAAIRDPSYPCCCDLTQQPIFPREIFSPANSSSIVVSFIPLCELSIPPRKVLLSADHSSIAGPYTIPIEPPVQGAIMRERAKVREILTFFVRV